jgi:hypothetical protein
MPYIGIRRRGKEVSSMEGILFDIEMFTSPISVLAGLALLVIAAGVILLGHTADEEAKGRRVFWAESPFTDVSEVAPTEKYAEIPRAA